MNQPVFHRLHPLTIVVESVRFIQRFILVFAVFIFSAVTGQGFDTTELILTGLGVFTIGSAVIRYYSFSYAVFQGSLLIQQGVFTKQMRTIPLDRIQNINLRRNLVHQLLGLVDLDIETAGGGQAEASLSALTEDQALRLKQELTGSHAAVVNPYLEARKEIPIYHATARELALAGATHNKALFLIIGLYGLAAPFPGMMSRLTDGVERLLRMSPEAAGPAAVVFWIGLTLAILVIGWIVSIAGTFISYWNFELTLRDGRLRRSYGLFSKIENVVPLHRIQVVRLTENFVQRLLGVCKMHVETAGAFAAGGEDQQNQTKATSLVAPLLRSEAVPGLLKLVSPAAQWDGAAWKKAGPKAVLRRAISGLWSALFVFAALAAYGALAPRSRELPELALPGIANPMISAAIVAGGLWLLIVLAASIYVRTSGCWDQGEVFATRKGWLSLRHHFVPVNKIQMVEWTQSPGQRRLGLASVTLTTAAGSGHATVGISDLDAEDARQLWASLHQRAANEAWANPDGY